MDPVTISGCVALATGCVKSIKATISAGRDLVLGQHRVQQGERHPEHACLATTGARQDDS